MEQQSLSELIRHIAIYQEAFIYQRIKKSGLTTAQAHVIHFLTTQPHAPQKEIASYLGKSEATTANVLKQLERKQLILRFSPKRDERLKQILLTPKGKDLAENVTEVFNQLDHVSPHLYRPELDSKLAELLTELLEHYQKS
ncbi:MarR family winged helix-turn-helix transcriptional regulator [Streptococcus ferus]|uniref:MarR family winged helix-turn-helix transcriptional regulator n=1 Tax=Streptococcus ferus TaxID=1345 RepID=UPI00359F231C